MNFVNTFLKNTFYRTHPVVAPVKACNFTNIRPRMCFCELSKTFWNVFWCAGFQKVQLFNLMRDYFPIRDQEMRVCKKVLLKEEILPHYQNSRYFRTYANSNKILIPCMFELTDVYYINLISMALPSHCFLFTFFKTGIFLRSSKLINKTKDYTYV